MISIPRIMVAGTHSGSGKTTVTCGLLYCLKNRGLKVRSFKCGPDYIDPMFHQQVIGVDGGNLDIFMTGETTVKYLLQEDGAAYDATVIEGVMGFYDGLGGTSDYASAAHVSRLTNTPVILVVDGKGMSLSVSAVVQGFLQFQENAICGVIMNRVSPGMFPLLKEKVEELTGIPVLGYLPELEQARIGSRHLGLVTAAEIDDLQDKISCIGVQMEKSVDMDRLMQLMVGAAPADCIRISIPVLPSPVRIGVARDQAFCFYYRENLALLEKMGAELVFFSPLKDDMLPPDLDGMILGGGYPELYLNALSANKSMRLAVGKAVGDGLPCVAECGGFMYLLEEIEGHPMAGAIEGKAWLTEKLVRFGYVQLEAQVDNLLCNTGDTIPAHEFHYSESDHSGSSFLAVKKSRSRQYACIHGSSTLFAGYPHIHFYGNLQFPWNFLNTALGNRSGSPGQEVLKER